jgi:hypothetical protein
MNAWTYIFIALQVFFAWRLITYGETYILSCYVLWGNVSWTNIRNIKRAGSRTANYHNRNGQINALEEIGGWAKYEVGKTSLQRKGEGSWTFPRVQWKQVMTNLHAELQVNPSTTGEAGNSCRGSWCRSENRLVQYEQTTHTQRYHTPCPR